MNGGREGLGSIRYGGRWAVACLIATVLFIYLTDEFTIKPERISGNGNPGIVPLFLGFVSALGFGAVYAVWLSYRPWSRGFFLGLLIVSILAFYVAVWMEYRFASDLFERFGGIGDGETNIDYRSIQLSQFTNTIYLNAYTFTGFAALVTAAVSAVRLSRK